MNRKVILFALLVILAIGSIVQADDLSGRDIMLKVSNGEDGDTSKYSLKMTLVNRVGK